MYKYRPKRLIAVAILLANVSTLTLAHAGWLARIKPDETVIYYDAATMAPLADVYVVASYNRWRSQMFVGSASHCVRTVGHLTGADGKVSIPVDAESTSGYARYVAIKLGYWEDKQLTEKYNENNPNTGHKKVFMRKQLPGQFHSSRYFYCATPESSQANAAGQRYEALHAQEEAIYRPVPAPPTITYISSEPPRHSGSLHINKAPSRSKQD